MCSGDIQAEEEVLEWLIEQRHEDTIENINRQMLYTLVDTSDYLAVYFCEYECTSGLVLLSLGFTFIYWSESFKNFL